jgi:hypothetical protein
MILMKKHGQRTEFDDKFKNWSPNKSPYAPKSNPSQKVMFQDTWHEWEYIEDPQVKPETEAPKYNELQEKFPFSENEDTKKPVPHSNQLDLEYPKLTEENISVEQMSPEHHDRITYELDYPIGFSNTTNYYGRSRIGSEEELKKVKQYLEENNISDLVKGRVLAKYEEVRQKSIEFYAKYQEANKLAETDYKINLTVNYEDFFREFSKLLVTEISKEIGRLFGNYTEKGLISSLREGLGIFNIDSYNFERRLDQMDKIIHAMNIIIIDYEHRKKILNQLQTKVDEEVDAFLSNPHWVEFLRWMDEYFPNHKEQFANQAIDAARKSSAMENSSISFSSLVRFKTYKSIYEASQLTATLDLKKRMHRSVSSEIQEELKFQIRNKIISKCKILQEFLTDLDKTNGELACQALVNFCKRSLNIDIRAIFTFGLNTTKKHNEYSNELYGTSEKAIADHADTIARVNKKFFDGFISSIPMILDTYLSSTGYSLNNEVDSLFHRIGDKFQHFANKEGLEAALKLNTKDMDQLATKFLYEKIIACMPGFQNKYESSDSGSRFPAFGGIRGVVEEMDGKFSIESFTNFAHSKTPFIPKELWLTTIRSFFKELDHRSLNRIYDLEGTNFQNGLKFIHNILVRDKKLEHNSFLKLVKNLHSYGQKFSTYKSGLSKSCTDEDTVEIMTLAVRSINTLDKDLDNLHEFIKLIHDEAGSLSSAVVKNIVKNKNFSNFNKVGIVKKVIRAYAQIRNRQGVKNIFKQYGPLISDLKRRKFIGSDFKENLLLIEKFFESNQEISPAVADFQKLFESASKIESDLSVIEMGDALKDLLIDYKVKDKSLFKLNLQLRDDIRFRVLGDKDPRILRIGIETDCCQRIGGAGEAAARDSFINPLSSVLVLEWKDSDTQEWKLLSQSYFHYVPAEKGYILDNIEHNGINVRAFTNSSELTLEEVYALYAEQIKNKLNIKYLLAGKSFSKISPEKFKTDKRYKDPRSFDNRALTPQSNSHYSDYDEKGSIDLLSPKFNLAKIQSKISKARAEVRQIIKAFINPSSLIRIAQQEQVEMGQDIRRLQGVKTHLFGPKSWDFINQFMNQINIGLSQLADSQKLGNQTINFQSVIRNPSAATRFSGGLKHLFNLSMKLWTVVVNARSEIYTVQEARNIIEDLLNNINESDFNESEGVRIKSQLINILNTWMSLLDNSN